VTRCVPGDSARSRPEPLARRTVVTVAVGAHRAAILLNALPAAILMNAYRRASWAI
jgi:hypothetical protein